MGYAKFIGGGLLSGLGQGMVMQAEDRRQEALELARQKFRSDELAEQRQFQTERDEKQHELSMAGRMIDQNFQLGRDEANRNFQAEQAEANRGHALEISDRSTQRALDVAGIRATGKGGSGAGSDEDGFVLSTDDERLLKRLDTQHAGDRAGMREELTRLGRDDLAVLYEMSMDEARRWVRDQDRAGRSWFNRTFGRSGLTAEEIDKRAEGILRENQPGGNRGLIQRPEPADAGMRVPEGLAGSGNQADPFRATTQEHIDWFRENAPPGSIIEANGTLYRK